MQRRVSKNPLNARLLEVAAATSLGCCGIWAARICVLRSVVLVDPRTHAVVPLGFHEYVEIACCIAPVLLTEGAILVSRCA